MPAPSCITGKQPETSKSGATLQRFLISISRNWIKLKIASIFQTDRIALGQKNELSHGALSGAPHDIEEGRTPMTTNTLTIPRLMITAAGFLLLGIAPLPAQTGDAANGKTLVGSVGC